ncbi:MAG: PTS sugar transporter subunit IIA [Bulleidia sp.]|nr:PTS sugar transporter subunit IIA [Bulleidia sp.]
MLKEFVEQKHCCFHDEAKDWKEAVRMSCEPLVADGTVVPGYADEIVACVEKNGPYIVLVPGVAMPHSTEDLGSGRVKRSSISFMKLQKPVHFDDPDPDKYADLFFTVCAKNPDEHMKNIQDLMNVLMNEDLLAELHQIKNEDDLVALGNKYNL